jgi:hypothetical protein
LGVTVVCENCGEAIEPPLPGRELSIVDRDGDYLILEAGAVDTVLVHSCTLAD